jgi:hypothetical protein
MENKKGKMKKIATFKILGSEDRGNMVKALANNGYFPTVIEKKSEPHLPWTDSFVEVYGKDVEPDKSNDACEICANCKSKNITKVGRLHIEYNNVEKRIECHDCKAKYSIWGSR